MKKLIIICSLPAGIEKAPKKYWKRIERLVVNGPTKVNIKYRGRVYEGVATIAFNQTLGYKVPSVSLSY